MLPITADISKLIVSNDSQRTIGITLKKSLGLGKFPYVMCQKVMDVPMNIFLITVDSRRPTVYLSPYRVKSADSSKLLRVKPYGLAYLAKSYKLTPPMQLERVSPMVGMGTLFIVRDLAGEYIHNTKMFEEKSKYVMLDYNLEKE